MSRFFNPKLAALRPYVPGEQPPNMDKLIKLNTNENPYPPGEKVKAALSLASAADLRLYPNPETRGLINAAAKTWGLQPGQIMAGNGSDEILAFCFQALCPNGAAFADISYGFYAVWASLYGVEYQTIALQDDFSLNIADYQGMAQTLFIANPNAPTGMAISTAAIETLLQEDKDRLLILDEAYADFASDNALRLIDKYDNLLIVRTMSKGYSLAGARIGFALGNEELIADLSRIKYSFNPYNLNRLSAVIGEAALLDQEYFLDCRSKIIAERIFLGQALTDLGFTVLPSETNFIFAGNHPQMSGRKYLLALREKNILVRHWQAERIRDFVRISIGTHEEILQLITATRQILKEA